MEMGKGEKMRTSVIASTIQIKLKTGHTNKYKLSKNILSKNNISLIAILKHIFQFYIVSPFLRDKHDPISIRENITEKIENSIIILLTVSHSLF